MTAFLSSLDAAGFTIMCLLLTVLWQSTILLAACGGLAFLLRRRKESVRHALWMSALIMLPLLPVLSWTVSEIGVRQREIPVIPVYSTTPVDRMDGTDGTVMGPMSGVAYPTSVPAGGIPKKSIRFYPWAAGMVVYAGVVLFLLSAILAGRLRVRRWILRGEAVIDDHTLAIFERVRERLGIRGEVTVLESGETSVPFAFRTLHPVVALPRGFAPRLTDTELTSVFAHELAHIRRRDPLTLTLVSLVRAVFFFQPLVWFASREAGYLAECACDSAALELTGEARSYAVLISRLAEELPKRTISPEYAAGLVFSRSVFLKRVEAILSENRNGIKRLTGLALAGTLAVATVSLAAALAFGPGEIKTTQADKKSAETQKAASRESTVAVKDSDTISRASVYGTVTYADNGKPAKGITVSIEKDKNATDLITDREGRYSFVGIVPGTYTMFFYDKAAADRNRLAKFAPLARRNVMVKAAQALGNVNVQLSRGGIITGRVTKSDTGEPVAGVKVYERDGKAVSGLTDRKGVYRMRISAGKSFLYTAAPWSPVIVYSLHRKNPNEGYSQQTASVSVDVREGATVADVNFSFRRIIGVKVMVLTPDGKPWGGAIVRSFQDRRTSKGDSVNVMPIVAITNADGNVFIESLLEGETTQLTASKEGSPFLGNLKFIPKYGNQEVIRCEKKEASKSNGRVLNQDGLPDPSDNPSNQIVLITGKVVGYDRKPVKDANVYLDSGKIALPIYFQPAKTVARTGNDGTFSFPLPAEQLDLGKRYNVVIIVGRGYAVFWQYIKGKPNLGDVTLQKAAKISAVIKDSSGRPVNGAALTVEEIIVPSSGMMSEQIPEMTGFSDARGKAMVSGLPENADVRVTVSSPGYAAELRRSIIPGKADDLSFTLLPEGRIEGRVTFSDTGKPAEGFSVKASGPSNWYQGGKEAMIDKDGRYFIPNAREGEYTIYVGLNRLGTDSSRYAIAIREHIRVDTGQITRNVDIQLVHGGIITGRVIMGDTGKPVPEKYVVCYNKGGGLTDAQGVYRIRSAPGSGGVSIFAPPITGYTAIPTEIPVTVKEGKTVNGVDFVYRKTASLTDSMLNPASVSGKVTFEDTGKPAEGICIRITSPTFLKVGKKTGPDGVYSFSGVPVGTYEMFFYSIADRDGNALPDHAPLTLKNIVVTAGKTPLKVNVRLTRGGIVTGRVTKADTGEPVAGVRVFENDTKAFPCITDERGIYRMRVSPGPARVYISDPIPKGYAPESPSASVLVREGKTVEGVDLAFRKITAVSGKILSPEGKPVGNAIVGVIRHVPLHDGTFSNMTGTEGVSNSDGTVALPGLVDGETSTLEVKTEKTGLRGRLEFTPHYSKETVRRDEFVIRLERFALHDLEGRIVDEAGAPVDMAKVTFTPNHGETNSGAYSNSMGKYRLIGLEAGKNYRITVEAKGYKTLERDLRPFSANMSPLKDIVLKKSAAN